jgi:ankyrin repeat protein
MSVQINQANNKGFTPLNTACLNGQLKVVKMLLAMNCIPANQAANNGLTPMMTALSQSHNDIVVQFLQQGIGHNNTNEWFSMKNKTKVSGRIMKNKIKVSGRIALYKYALLLPQQHQPLLDFHACLLRSQHALVPASALKVFKTIWPLVVAFTIESFLLPTKQTRRTLLQVISRFHATLNDYDELKQTLLYRAVDEVDVDSVRFLLLQDGILINKCSNVMLYSASSLGDDHVHYDTPLYRAVQNGIFFSDDEVKFEVAGEIAELLNDAGGRSLSSEEPFEA